MQNKKYNPLLLYIKKPKAKAKPLPKPKTKTEPKT